MRSLRGPRTVAAGDTCMALASRSSYHRCGEALETAHLFQCRIDEVAIARFLKHAPCLRKLAYSHYSTDPRQDWDICEYATSIEREAESYLEELQSLYMK
jgi:hypothetical protein